jgi:hypothetical protein
MILLCIVVAIHNHILSSVFTPRPTSLLAVTELLCSHYDVYVFAHHFIIVTIDQTTRHPDVDTLLTRLYDDTRIAKVCYSYLLRLFALYVS